MNMHYCVELDLTEMMITIHRHSCLSYPHSRIRLSRVVDLGEFEAVASAVNHAKQSYPPPWQYSQCLCLVRPETSKRSELAPARQPAASLNGRRQA